MEILNGFPQLHIFHSAAKRTHHRVHRLRYFHHFLWRFITMNVRNELKAQIVRAGMTMQEVVDQLSEEYGWSDSVSNLSAKLQRESIRY